MAKPQHVYTCQACGAIWPKWAGKCEACGEWNTLVEETARYLDGRGRDEARALPRQAAMLYA
ncbi:MAG TPA: DUF1465 family protein, partial [Terricaulis sp.]|nr:DUF1465 family protein [Terricaulis sp.]